MKVYLAGKIKGSEPWRELFVPGWARCILLRDYEREGYKTTRVLYESGGREVWQETSQEAVWPVYKGGFLGIADYVGPYGVMDAQSSPEHNWEFLDGLGGSREPYWSPRLRRIAERCMEAVVACDAMVAVFTGHDSPGMLCEIGYARAKGRPVIAIVRGAQPDWFPLSLCDHVEFFDDGPDTWTEILAWANNLLFHFLSTLIRKDMGRYYKSPHWKARRQASLDKSGGKCQFCAGTAGLQVHHNSYENLYQEPDCDLVVLCDPCHRAADAKRRAREAVATN